MAGVNANVTLTLQELDNLRNEVREAKQEKIEALAQVKKLENEKHQVKVTVRQLYQSPSIERVYDPNYDNGSGYPYAYGEPRMPSYRTVMKNCEASSVEYINLDEIKGDILAQAQQKVADELITLKNNVTKLIKEKGDLETKHYSDKSALITDFERLKAETAKEHETKVTSLSNEIKSLRDEEVEKTKDQLIKDLQKQISELKNQSIFSKLFS